MTVSLSFSTAILLSLFSSPTIIQHPTGWLEVKPGGDTRCARGGEYAFFVRPGDNDKLAVDFIGGGACWDGVTCSPESATFTDNVDELRDMVRRGDFHGVYDATIAANPLKNHTHLVIPYCTGDVHWGDSEHTYTRANGTQFQISHRGAINARAALAWMQENITAPERIAVIGCSAGSYGSIYWAPFVRDTYPDAEFRHFGDAGVGVMTESFTQRVFPLWNVTAHATRSIPSLDPDQVDWTTLKLRDMYVRIAEHYPDSMFAQYSSNQDFIQRWFYIQMGGIPADWSPAMRTTLQEIGTARDNFRSYIAPYDGHCAITEDDFYTMSSAGQLLPVWLSRYLNGPARDAPTSVDCGDDCG